MLQRFELSQIERVRRSIFEILIDHLDSALINHSLIGSYENFQKAGEKFPFVETKELKPGAKTPTFEHKPFNDFLVISTEAPIPKDLRKYITFRRKNQVSSESLKNIKLANINLGDTYVSRAKSFEDASAEPLLRALLPEDFASLIQPDPAVKNPLKYAITHFRASVEIGLDDAVEQWAKALGYISKSIYENEDEKGFEEFDEIIKEKFYESHCFHRESVHGRRTAAIKANIVLSLMTNFKGFVYASSSESRTLTKLGNGTIHRYTLIKIPKKDQAKIKKIYPDTNLSNFVIDNKRNVFLFEIIYEKTTLAHSSEKKREFELQELDSAWTKILSQQIIPKPWKDGTPIPYFPIYSPKDPFLKK